VRRGYDAALDPSPREDAVIASFWSALGASAAILAAAAFAVLVAFVGAMLAHINGILDSVRRQVDERGDEVGSALREATRTIEGVNKEIGRVDGIVESTGNIVRSVERVSSVVEQAVSSPLIKVAAAGAGLSRALKRSKKKRET